MSSLSIRAPTWVSRRRLLEHKLSELQEHANLNHLKQVYALIYKENLHQDLFISTKLIDSFSLCGQTMSAVNVFNQTLHHDTRIFNKLIRSHIQNSENPQAFSTFIQMQKVGVQPDNFTYSFILKALFGRQDAFPLVQMVHAAVEKNGFCSDVYVPNSLIDTYSKCGCVSEARKLFEIMENRDKVSWNSMISGLVKTGELDHARLLFDEMPERNSYSWNIMIDGYVKSGYMNYALELFDKMPERNVVSWTTLISGFCKVGDMKMAGMLFDQMPVKNLVTWTAIISGFAEKGLLKEAISLYEQLKNSSGFQLDDSSIIAILSACAQSGLLGLGKNLHEYMNRTRYNFKTGVSNALLAMYSKCGKLTMAVNVFNEIRKKDLVSWNAMIQGLAMHGQGEEALVLFSRMKREGFEPDEFTFVGVLSACTHAGLTDEGLRFFYEMETKYGIVPRIEHYGCAVDLLGRAGRLMDCFRLVNDDMPMDANAIIWSTLLAACRQYNDVELAKIVEGRLRKLEMKEDGNFSMMSNIYAAAGDWDGVAVVRTQMKNMVFDKVSGASSIELDEEVHEFTAKDTKHKDLENIYRVIDWLGLHLKKVENCCVDDEHCFVYTC
ncbi:pentatricopeptide repeat-containing protein At3g29230-like [Impatiens glandulifera]|uniref:pentatricopeptide repeat-containing protein At3g29230-like n=1 Tax=Impatiens glandulifera TaxID=253017 RepID=UPI001FB15F6A|nr:pentatricopeptide repeat-containing protein At3g29230-like [Impatiens glandulifera]